MALGFKPGDGNRGFLGCGFKPKCLHCLDLVVVVCVCVCGGGGGVVGGIMKHHLYNARDERRVEWIHGLRKGGMEESNSVLTWPESFLGFPSIGIQESVTKLEERLQAWVGGFGLKKVTLSPDLTRPSTDTTDINPKARLTNPDFQKFSQDEWNSTAHDENDEQGGNHYPGDSVLLC